MQTGTFILAKLRGAQRKDPGGEAPFKGRCHLCFLSLSVAGGVPQVFLTAPSGTVQIPVSAVQLHQVGAERYLRVFKGGGGGVVLALPPLARPGRPRVGVVLGFGRAVSAIHPWVRKPCPPWTGTQKGRCHPGCWHAGSRGTPSRPPSASSCLFSLDGCHRAAEQQWQQPDGAAGGQLGHLAQRQE